MNPRQWPDGRLSGLQQTGPPPGANNVRFRMKGFFSCNTVAELREIQTAEENKKWGVILLGENAAYDGLLSGIYSYVPEGYHNAQEDNGASWIIVNDGKSAWRKMI